MLPALPFRNCNMPPFNIQVNLIGKKVQEPMIHFCETCTLPIRNYGRMIPCKHVFCFSCAEKTGSNCPRCKDAVVRIEQCPTGTVWMCAVTTGCKRTYLSKRDLLAHINHRHSKQQTPPQMVIQPPTNTMGPPPTGVVSVVGTPANIMGPPNVVGPPPPMSVPPPPNFMMTAGPSPIVSTPIPMMGANGGNQLDQIAAIRASSSNLITIPIQTDCSIPPPPVVPPPNQQQFALGPPPVLQPPQCQQQGRRF